MGKPKLKWEDVYDYSDDVFGYEAYYESYILRIIRRRDLILECDIITDYYSFFNSDYNLGTFSLDNTTLENVMVFMENELLKIVTKKARNLKILLEGGQP